MSRVNGVFNTFYNLFYKNMKIRFIPVFALAFLLTFHEEYFGVPFNNADFAEPIDGNSSPTTSGLTDGNVPEAVTEETQVILLGRKLNYQMILFCYSMVMEELQK